jgi:hypothetical protein
VSSRRSKEPFGAELSVRQREWFQHLRAAERSGGTIKAYAAAHGLSVQSLYAAGKRLRHGGLLEPRIQRRFAGVGRAFVKVESAAARRDVGPAWRIRLPSGVVFESSAPLAHDDLLSLLATLAALR